jgi:hypothetical protein
LSKKVNTMFSSSFKTKETFLVGEHMPTLTVVKGGSPSFIERHIHFKLPGPLAVMDHDQVDPAIPLGPENSTWEKDTISIRLDQWLEGPVVGGKFELHYIVKFSDGETVKSNVLVGKVG